MHVSTPVLQVVSGFHSHVDLSKMDAVVAEVRALDERLRKADRDAGLYNSREALLGLPPSDYSALRKVIEAFDPFLQVGGWVAGGGWWVVGGGGGGGGGRGGCQGWAVPSCRWGGGGGESGGVGRVSARAA